MLRRLCVLLSTGFGLGYAPKAPGTFGTVLGIPLAWTLTFVADPALRAVAIVGLILLSVAVVHHALPALGRGKDPGCVVLDETVTVPMTFFLVPMSSVFVVLAGFALHRLFDITKPPPARQLEKLPGAWGVVADDCAAGVYSNLALHLLLYLVPSLAV